MTPSVGRIVHYKSEGSTTGKYPSVCRAAIITDAGVMMQEGVEPPVSLAVLNPEGMYFNRAVRHDESGERGTWHWPERVE